MSLRIYAQVLTFATKHGRYLRNMDKIGIGALSFVRASSEPFMFDPLTTIITRGFVVWDIIIVVDGIYYCGLECMVVLR